MVRNRKNILSNKTNVKKGFFEESLRITSPSEVSHVLPAPLCVVLRRSSSLPPLSLLLGDSTIH